MGRRRVTTAALAAVVVAVIIATSASVARGGIIWGTGNIHVSATVSGGGASSPPDVFYTTSGSNSALIGFGTFPSSFISVQVACSIVSPYFQVTANTTCTSGAAAFGSGTIPLTITGGQDLVAQGSVNGFAFLSANIKDAASTTVFSTTLNPMNPGSSNNLTLSPGQYTLSWNLDGEPITGVGGAGTERFSLIPEPAAAAATLVCLAACASLRTRPRRRQ
jgi:hypothetical protein